MTGRVIGVPNYTGRQSDSVYAKMQWFIDHYDLFKLVQDNSFLYADSYATIPALTGIYKLADTGQVWQRLSNGTLVRRQALEVSPETLSAMQSLFDNVSSEWNTVYKPAISADRTAFAYQQALNNAQAAVNSNKTPAASTAAIPATVGLYYITGQAEAGQVWERLAVAENGSTLKRRVELEAIGLPALHYIDARRESMSPTATATENSTRLQKLIDDAPAGATIVVPPGRYKMNKEIYVGKDGLTLIGDGVILEYQNTASLGSFIIHGAGYVRGTTAVNFGTHVVAIRWADMSPVKNVRIQGFEITSPSASTKAGNTLWFIDAQDCVADSFKIQHANGAAVEMRYCVNLLLRNFYLWRYKTYGLFFYQSHKCKAESFRVREGGRAWEVKQRHKNYQSVSHVIRDFLVEDCTGFPPPGQSTTLPGGVVLSANPYWITGGVAYGDLSNKNPDGSNAYPDPIPAERNFPGHEKTADVLIANGAFKVTDNAWAESVSPALLTGAFATQYVFENITISGADRKTDYPPFSLGNSDVAVAQAEGAYFGGNFVVYGGYITRINTSGAIFNYTVEATVDGVKVDNCTCRQISAQSEPRSGDPITSVLPKGEVAWFEIKNCQIDVNMLLSSVGTGGIYAGTATKSLRSKNNKITIKPVNFLNSDGSILTSYSTIQAYSVHATHADIGQGDVINIVSNAEATNHGTTYGVYTRQVAGSLAGMNLGVAAPTTAIGVIYLPPATTGGMSLGENKLRLLNTPTGIKTAVRTDGELRTHVTQTLEGAWTTTLQDSTNLNRQNLGRLLWASSMPTTGTFTKGDFVLNMSFSAVNGRQLIGWRRAVTGNTHVAGTDWFLVYQAAEARLGTGANNANANYVGEEYYDQTNKKWYKAGSVGSGAADWLLMN